MTDLGILHFHDVLVPGSLPGSLSRIFQYGDSRKSLSDIDVAVIFWVEN
jgi:hypothetical protein